MTRRLVRFLDERVGVAPLIRKALRYVFPDHWSFMLGEIALYAFVVLVATGIYLTLFYVPSHEHVVYHGGYEPLRGMEVTKAYQSVLDISFDVPVGLVIRQAHHWAADVFIAAIVLHALRIFFTGAFRKPREINYWVGITMLLLALPEGFLGYSLADDLLSGMGLAIAYAVSLSIPVIGGFSTFLAFGGEFPGSSDFFSRMFIVHVLIIPVTIAALLTVHLVTIVRQHHTQFAGAGRTERNVVGTPMWPGYVLRSLGLFFAVAAVLFLLGGLVQINPIWEWGPYHVYSGTNGAQPDWYLGWLIGGLRLMFPFEPHVAGYTVVPNPFWGGALFPLAVFGYLYAWPFIERRWITRDYARHELLDRPRDNPTRTAVGAGVLTWVSLIFVVGSFDRLYFRLELPYEGQVWIWRFAVIVIPVLVFFLTRKVCRDLRAGDTHPLRGWDGGVVRRTGSGGYAVERPQPGERDEPEVAVNAPGGEDAAHRPEPRT